MISNLKNKLSIIDVRSLKIYKNITGMFGIKFINIFIGLLLIPFTINYLHSEKYGVWITIFTIFNWVSVMDIGLGNGLRNKLTESISSKDFSSAKVLVSSTYAILIVIFSVMYILFFIVNYYINWNLVLNTDAISLVDLRMLTSILFIFFCINFIAKLITNIAYAKQQPAFSNGIELTGRILTLVAVIIITNTTDNNLLLICTTLIAVPAIVYIVISAIWFNTAYKDIKPSFRLIDFKQLKGISNLGIKFFFIQIAFLIYYQTNNVIIIQLFGPSEVTNYNIAFQYFSVGSMMFLTILTPYWSAITDAYTKGEYDWIKNSIIKLKKFWIILLIVVIIMFFLSEKVVHFWIGENVKVDQLLYVIMGVYILVYAYIGIYSHFLNGVGKIKLQFVISFTFAIIHIPLAVFLGKQFGIQGILYGTIFLGIVTANIYSKQYRLILSGKGQGIWAN